MTANSAEVRELILAESRWMAEGDIEQARLCRREIARLQARERPSCQRCSRRIIRGANGRWQHLSTVAGLEAETDHAARPSSFDMNDEERRVAFGEGQGVR